MDKKKICVVGNGLAGACVSYHLIKAGAEVTVYDNGSNHSSVVAAGLITPLVFRRMNKSWRVDEFMDYLVPFYRSFETSDQEVLRDIPLRRMFASEQERGYWLERQHTPEYSAYMAPVSEEDDNYAHAINNLGSGRVQNCYAVNAQPFLPRPVDNIRLYFWYPSFPIFTENLPPFSISAALVIILIVPPTEEIASFDALNPRCI